MTNELEGGVPDGGGAPWICETCGHFMVLRGGRDVSAFACLDVDGPHRLTAYTGTEMAIRIRNDRNNRVQTSGR